MKKPYWIIFSLLFFLLAIDSVNAIGIGPPRINIDFIPGLEQTIEYTIFNNLDSSSRVDMYVKGDLSDYISLDKTSLTIGPNGKGDITATLKLPQQIDIPGNHEIKIGAIASPSNTPQGTVGAKAAVESQLNIFVPYQGEFLVAYIEATSVETGETADFTIHLSNKGLENISSTTASIDIYFKDQLIATVYTESKKLDSGTEDILSAKWPTAGASAGTYKAVAKLSYDNNTKEIETDFNVGSPLAEIMNITINKFSHGEIAKITVNAKSYWNKPLENVYATIDIFDNENKTIGSIKSSPGNIDSLSESQFELFWDTKNIEIGDYSAKATLNYLDKKAEQNFIISVSKDNTLIVVSITFIIAVLLFILWKFLLSSAISGRKK